MQTESEIELESRRLRALKEYHVLDTGRESEFDAITRLASYICKTPISLISLVEEDRLWFKSRYGAEATESPRSTSFCQFTIQGEAIFEINDTRKDERFRDNPFVTGYPQIRFYAGAPLITPEGYCLGSLCVIDKKPNQLDDEQRDALRILANEVISHLEVAKKNRQLQESLAAAEEFNTMFNSSGELHCILDEYGKIEKINRSVTKILGYQVEEALGRNMWQFCHKDDREKTLRYLESKLTQGDRQFDLETRIRTQDGKMRWISWAAAVKNRKWFANGRDVTDQKNLLAELEQLSLVASKVDNGVVISDAQNEVIWVNEAFEKITGYPLAEVGGRKLGDVLKGEDTDENTILSAREFTRNKQSFSVELLVYRRDGTPLWVSVMNSVILNEAGEIDREIEIITDISTRKQHEEELQTLSLAAGKSSSGIFVRRATGEIIWFNEAFERITGYSLAELKGRPFGELMIGEETDLELLEKAKLAAAEKRPYEVENRIYRKDGTPLWVFISNNPLFNAEGEMERQVGFVVDISERKKASEQIQLLSLVASKTVNGVVINDALGRAKWVNDSFEKITGYTLAEVKGKRIGDLLKGPETDLAELDRVRALAGDRQPFHAELLTYRKNGSAFWVSVSNTPIFDSNGKIEQEIEIVNDISERKLAEQELIKTREEALQLSKAKEMFLSVMSHEIRTPLNAVIGTTHILMDEDPSPAQKEHLDILQFSADNLLSLLNAILDFTKIETGNLILESADLQLRELVHHTLDSFKFKTRAEGVELVAHIDPRIPEVVKGDQTRLYQVLINLVGNAMKFTHRGEVRLDLGLMNQDEHTVGVRFTVSDTGIGIPQDKLQYIFEAYAQAQADTTRKYGGTGLGLAITKRLIELFGSEIVVESEEGKGSKFIFTVQFKSAGVSAALTPKSMEFRQFSSNVLVVDDNDINRLLAKKVLIKWGIEPDFAENGEVALQKIQQHKYDLVLMDIHMPVMGGKEAALKIRQMEGTYYQQLPVIALTASMMSKELEDIENSGMNGFVQKPFSPQELYEKIEKFLS